MKLKLVSAACIFVVSAGASLAQDSILMDKALMGPFFTDPTMATLRADEELTAEFSKMSPENQQKLIQECKKSENREQQYNDLCKKISPQ